MGFAFCFGEASSVSICIEKKVSTQPPCFETGENGDVLYVFEAPLCSVGPRVVSWTPKLQSFPVTLDLPTGFWEGGSWLGSRRICWAKTSKRSAHQVQTVVHLCVCCGGNMCLDPLWTPVPPLPLTPKGRSECERLLRSRTHTWRRAPALLPRRSPMPLLLNGHQCTASLQLMSPPKRRSSVAVGTAPQVCGGCCHPHRCRSRM